MKKLFNNYEKTIQKLSENYSPSQSFFEKVTEFVLKILIAFEKFYFSQSFENIVTFFINVVTFFFENIVTTKSKEKGDDKEQRKEQDSINDVFITADNLLIFEDHPKHNPASAKPEKNKLFKRGAIPTTRIMWS